MIAPMERVEIVCLRSELQAMVPLLQEQGVMHVEEVSLALENHPGYLHRVHLPEAEKAELSELEELDSLIRESQPLLAVEPRRDAIASAAKVVESRSFRARLKKCRTWHRQLRTLHRRKLNVEDNMAVIKNYGRIIETITPLLIGQGAILGETARAVILEGYDAGALEDLQRSTIADVGSTCGFMTQKLDRNRQVMVITHAKDKSETLSDFLARKGISILTSPDRDARGTSVDEVMRKIGTRIAALQADLDEVTSQLDAYSREEGAPMTALGQIVGTRVAQLHVVDSFAQSEMIGVVQGWVPSDAYHALETELGNQFGDKAIVTKLSHKDVEHDRIPTLLQNHAIFKPFELIMTMLKPASYGSIDPTALVATSFILFYGFILGDAGYGILIMLIGWLAKKKFGHIEAVRDGMTIFQWMGASSIVFGLVYWEIFGNFVELQIGGHAIFHRAHETDMLLYLAVAFGIIHIPLSLILGIKEGFAHGHNKHAEEKLGMLLGLVALAVVLITASGSLPIGATVGYVLAVALLCSSIYYLIRGMGAMAPMGAMEIVGLSANILSYSRLMALGIASIAFADIANGLPEMLGGGTIGVIIGIPAALAVHVLNIGIGVFSPTIHSLRLNFVEFLPKFYEPQGRSYEPFRKEIAW
jgi:V/A-type H+/Na+-transporting ATPase subunit I